MLLIAISPIIATSPLMDVRFWFTEYVSAMDYSATNIYGVWQSYLLPGRFVPLSDLFIFTYAFIGHKFLQFTQLSVNYFDAITKLTLLLFIFLAIRALFNEIGKGVTGVKNRNLLNFYPVALCTIWGLGLNIFWKSNGAIAYPAYIYTTFLVSIVFALAALRNIRTLVATNNTFNRVTIFLLITSTIWANFFYELSYTAIAAIAVTIYVAPLPELTKASRLKLIALFISAFAIVWIPMRWYLNNQCLAHLDLCYSGSQLNIGGMPLTFMQNLVNPLPFADYNSINDLRNGKLPFVFSGPVLIFAVLIAALVLANLQNVNNTRDSSENINLDSFISIQWRFTSIMLTMGVTGALILSVSVRAQDLVNWGLSYRHTPILWMGYASLILLAITWLARKVKPVFGVAAITLLILILSTGQWGRSWSTVHSYNSDFEPVSRLYHELYNADLSTTGTANSRRCLIEDELSKKDINIGLYIDPAEKFMQKFHGRAFCKR
jgi:hypothetical protein